MTRERFIGTRGEGLTGDSQDNKQEEKLFKHSNELETIKLRPTNAIHCITDLLILDNSGLSRKLVIDFRIRAY